MLHETTSAWEGVSGAKLEIIAFDAPRLLPVDSNSSSAPSERPEDPVMLVNSVEKCITLNWMLGSRSLRVGSEGSGL